MDFQAASQAGWSAGGNAVRAGALRFRCPVEGCGTVGYPDPETLLNHTRIAHSRGTGQNTNTNGHGSGITDGNAIGGQGVMHNGRIYNVQGNYDPRQIITGMLEHASERQMEREEGIFEVTRQWVESPLPFPPITRNRLHDLMIKHHISAFVPLSNPSQQMKIDRIAGELGIKIRFQDWDDKCDALMWEKLYKTIEGIRQRMLKTGEITKEEGEGEGWRLGSVDEGGLEGHVNRRGIEGGEMENTPPMTPVAGTEGERDGKEQRDKETKDMTNEEIVVKALELWKALDRDGQEILVKGQMYGARDAERLRDLVAKSGRRGGEVEKRNERVEVVRKEVGVQTVHMALPLPSSRFTSFGVGERAPAMVSRATSVPKETRAIPSTELQIPQPGNQHPMPRQEMRIPENQIPITIADGDEGELDLETTIARNRERLREERRQQKARENEEKEREKAREKARETEKEGKGKGLLEKGKGKEKVKRDRSLEETEKRKRESGKKLEESLQREEKSDEERESKKRRVET